MEILSKHPALRAIVNAIGQVLYVARLGITIPGMGRHLLRFLDTLGGIALLFLETLFRLVLPPYRFRLFIRQAAVAGWQSLPLILVVLGLLGMITVIELNFQLDRIIRDVSQAPGVAGLMFFRVFGPTVVAAMLAAKVGAGFTAEIGTMNATDQVDALKLMGVNPVHYLVVPRFAACVVMQVALSIVGVFAAFMGGFIANYSAVNFQTYVGIMSAYISWDTMVYLMFKSLGLSWVVPITACFYGLRCTGGAKGVGEATTRAVVTSILIIIVLDFTISAVADKLVSAAMSFIP